MRDDGVFYRNLTGDTPLPPARALGAAPPHLRGLTPSQIDGRYTDLGGAADPDAADADG